MTAGASAHVFSVDVEEWFQVNALEPWVARDRWGEYESRVEASTDRVLELLARHGAHGTFFTLGWVAERHPALVRRIAAAGHEVASHGWWHRRVTTLAPAAFLEDLRASKAVLEDASGQRVLGFRAPSFQELYLLFNNESVGYTVQGNPNLRPEISQALNLGGEYTPVSWFTFGINGYYNDLNNLIAPIAGQNVDAAFGTVFSYGNIAHARTIVTSS